MKHSGSYMTQEIAKGKDPEKVINEGYGFELSKDDMKAIKKQAKNIKKYNEDDKDYAAELQKLQDAIQKPINDESHTGWTTNGHTGEDVNTYAFGPGSDRYQGNIDDTDDAKNIFDFFRNSAK